MMNSLELFKDSNYLEKEESEGEGGGSGEVNAMHRHFNLVLGQECVYGGDRDSGNVFFSKTFSLLLQ